MPPNPTLTWFRGVTKVKIRLYWLYIAHEGIFFSYCFTAGRGFKGVVENSLCGGHINNHLLVLAQLQTNYFYSF